MASFIVGNGTSIPADEAFETWTSHDRARMLRARSNPTHPIDRHFLLMGIIGQAYARRAEPEMHDLCLEVARQHVAEFPSIAPVLAEDLRGILPRVPTFAHLATVLREDEEYEEAISVCELAVSLGLGDGTKGDFPARIKRIQKAALRSRGHSD